MSTRTNIYLADRNGNRLWLYRHYDGYPAATGVDIAQKLKRLSKGYARTHGGSFAALSNALLAERYEKQSYEPEARAIYSVTTGEHGDIEWKYVVNCRKSGAVVIEVHEYSLRADAWTCHGAMGEKEFRSFCARELMERRKRMQAFKAKRAA